jgi:hypothetical protein
MGEDQSQRGMGGIMQAKATMKIANTIRLVAIAGFVSVLCLAAFASRGDDTVKKPQDQARTLEDWLADIIGNIVKEGTANLLSSLHVEKGVEMSLWEIIMSPDSFTREESAQFDGSTDEETGALIVQLTFQARARPKKSEGWFRSPKACTFRCHTMS